MNLSNTGGGGRGSDKGEIIGDVICHGKRQFWLKGGAYHYHHGLKAGEGTLEASLERLLLRSMVTHGGHFDRDSFLDSYIGFMTTKGSHNDVYAGTCHRMFFANWVQGKDPKNCAVRLFSFHPPTRGKIQSFIHPPTHPPTCLSIQRTTTGTTWIPSMGWSPSFPLPSRVWVAWTAARAAAASGPP